MAKTSSGKGKGKGKTKTAVSGNGNGAGNGARFPLHLDRNHLPEPEWKFAHAKIRTYATESQPDFPPVRTAPKESPNILLVLLDDVGFGWPSVNGGLVRTPTAEKLAKNGLFRLFPFTGSIDSVTFAFGAHRQPSGMERLELATRMD